MNGWIITIWYLAGNENNDQIFHRLTNNNGSHIIYYRYVSVWSRIGEVIVGEDGWYSNMDTVINDNNNDFWHAICLYTWVGWMGSNQVHEQGIKKCENKSSVE